MNTAKSFYRNVFMITIPIALQNMISYGVNMMDTFMLGSLGEVAISAASLANQIFFMFTVIEFGIGGGAMVLCSQYWGKRDTQSIQKITNLTLAISFAVSMVFFCGIFFFPQQAMGIFTPEPEVIAAGAEYLRVVAVSYLFYSFTTIFLVILRSVETVNISLVIYSISFVVNVFFNYMFIFGKLGAPRMGVAGAAMGTVIARAVELGIMIIYLFRVEKKIRFKAKMFLCFEPLLFKDILRYGLPVMCSESFWAIGISLHSVILGHMGSSVVAANSICNVVFQMLTSFVLGVSSASAVLTGKMIGAGEIEETKRCVPRFLGIYLVMGAATALFLLVIRHAVIGLYDIAEGTKALAEQFMYFYSAILFFFAFTCPSISGLLRGSGDTKFAAFVDLTFLWCLLPIGALGAFVWNWPPVVVLMLLRGDMPLKTVLCLWRLRGNDWIRSVTREEL